MRGLLKGRSKEREKKILNKKEQFFYGNRYGLLDDENTYKMNYINLCILSIIKLHSKIRNIWSNVLEHTHEEHHLHHHLLKTYYRNESMIIHHLVQSQTFLLFFWYVCVFCLFFLPVTGWIQSKSIQIF